MLHSEITRNDTERIVQEQVGNRFSILIVFIVILMLGVVAAEGELTIRHGFVTRNIAKRWEHGLFCGNGYVGAVVMGEPINEKIIIDHEKLFLPTKESITLKFLLK